ncbi:MAG: hypothetical protein R2788_16940 [Saprospiraceae bacterium]
MISLDHITIVDASSDFFGEENAVESDHHGGENDPKNRADGMGEGKAPIIKRTTSGYEDLALATLFARTR